MKKILALTALSTVLFSAESFALTFVNIDDFNSNDHTVTDTVLGGGGNTSTNASRSLGIELLSGTAPISNEAQVIAGILDVVNGGGDDSVVTVAWNLANGFLPSTATNAGFFLSVLQSDGNPTALDFSFNSNPLASFSIAANTLNQNIFFGLTSAQVALLSVGGSLSLAINGAPGWDLSIDSFGFSFDLPTPPPGSVPEPAALVLLGAGLVGLGYRKKKQG